MLRERKAVAASLLWPFFLERTLLFVSDHQERAKLPATSFCRVVCAFDFAPNFTIFFSCPSLFFEMGLLAKFIEVKSTET